MDGDSVEADSVEADAGKIQYCYRNHPENQRLKKVKNLSEGSLGDKGTLRQHEVSSPMASYRTKIKYLSSNGK